jgi:CHAT domain-containing protein
MTHTGHPFLNNVSGVILVLVADEHKRLYFLLVDDLLYLLRLSNDLVSIQVKHLVRQADVISSLKVHQQLIQLLKLILYSVLVKTFVFHQDKQIAIWPFHFLQDSD